MKKIVVLLAAILAAAPVFAGDTGYVKLSLWGDIAVAVPNNIHNITGLDLGLGSDADTVDGIQYDLIYGNANKVRGIKTAWFYSTADVVYGLQGGLVSVNRRDMRGLQGGLVSINEGKMQGIHSGFVTWSKGPTQPINRSPESGDECRLVASWRHLGRRADTTRTQSSLLAPRHRSFR